MAEVRPLTVLLDVNVVLDVLLQREPFFANSRALWQACDNGQFEGYLTSTTFTNIYYIARRTIGAERALQSVATCLRAFQVAPVYRETIEAAIRGAGTDFEDNVQIASAITSFLDVIVTRDQTGYRQSPVTVMSPSQFLDYLKQKRA